MKSFQSIDKSSKKSKNTKNEQKDPKKNLKKNNSINDEGDIDDDYDSDDYETLSECSEDEGILMNQYISGAFIFPDVETLLGIEV